VCRYNLIRKSYLRINKNDKGGNEILVSFNVVETVLVSIRLYYYYYYYILRFEWKKITDDYLAWRVFPTRSNYNRENYEKNALTGVCVCVYVEKALINKMLLNDDDVINYLGRLFSIVVYQCWQMTVV